MGRNLDSVAPNIKKDMKVAISWHKNKEIVEKTEKCQLILTGLKDEIKFRTYIKGIVIQMIDSLKLMVATI